MSKSNVKKWGRRRKLILKYENKLYNYKHINIIISYTTQTYLAKSIDKKTRIKYLIVQIHIIYYKRLYYLSYMYDILLNVNVLIFKIRIP